MNPGLSHVCIMLSWYVREKNGRKVLGCMYISIPSCMPVSRRRCCEERWKVLVAGGEQACSSD